MELGFQLSSRISVRKVHVVRPVCLCGCSAHVLHTNKQTAVYLCLLAAQLTPCVA